MRKPDNERRFGAVRKVGLIALANVLLVIVLFALLEGAASTLFVAHEIVNTPAVPEHRHAEHDTLLGWVNLPDVHLPDAYGPGVGIRTNGQRFRNDRDFSVEVPAGRIRLICSGDSFTFGYGVANDQVWCERLSALDERLETVNMGLGGYGVDQAYLWYRRDGTRLDHQLQILAFLTDDFHRMKSDRFMGYGKPLLELAGDSLAVANLPVPETSWLARRMALHGETLARLDMVRLMRRVLPRDAKAAARREEQADQELRGIVARIFADLRRMNEARGSVLVLVYFPGVWDDQVNATTDAWRRFIREEAARQEIPYFDLVEEMRRLPAVEVGPLFEPNLHFSVAGNAWAAEVLHRKLAPFMER